MQSALPAAVNRQERPKVHLPLTCIIFDPMVHPCFGSNLRRVFASSGIYKWLRLCDLRDMKNWSICDIFLKKQPEDKQEAIAIQTVIRCKGKILCFSNLSNEVFYCLNGIYVPPWVLKFTQGQYFAIQGKPKVVYLFCSTRNLAGSSAPWFMVNHEFTSNWFYGKMGLPGVTGG